MLPEQLLLLMLEHVGGLDDWLPLPLSNVEFELSSKAAEDTVFLSVAVRPFPVFPRDPFRNNDRPHLLFSSGDRRALLGAEAWATGDDARAARAGISRNRATWSTAVGQCKMNSAGRALENVFNECQCLQ
jgi:hypothetical protein